MALDLEKLKQNLSSDKLKGMFSKKGVQEKVGQWSFASRYPKIAAFKTGLQDIKNVIAEGKISLFVKQIVVLAAVFLLVKTVNGKLVAHRAELKDQMSAITIQHANREDYLNNKEHLLQLEPLFPDIEQKSDWMPSALMSLFGKHDLSPKLDGNFAENAEKTYTTVSQTVSWKQSYQQLGEMLADMENGDAFLRVSEVSISKLSGKDELGSNTVTVRFNTVFPKMKYAPKLFKDYKQQMDKINARKQAAKATEAKVKAEESK